MSETDEEDNTEFCQAPTNVENEVLALENKITLLWREQEPSQPNNRRYGKEGQILWFFAVKTYKTDNLIAKASQAVREEYLRRNPAEKKRLAVNVDIHEYFDLIASEDQGS